MTEPHDPFANHPELRHKVIDPHQSYFRTFRPSDLDQRMAEAGLPPNWRLSDEEREATRHETLAGHTDSDLWVFAYGSLMWNPAFLFEEVRRAEVTGYSRRFCLQDDIGGRGSPEAPGLMAALDRGDRCAGLVFRIAEGRIDAETEILWRREMIAGSYIPAIVDAISDEGPVKAVTFVANREVRRIRPDISRAEQVRFIATGTGTLGSSLEYIQNLVDHLRALELDDPDVFSLLQEAEAYAASL